MEDARPTGYRAGFQGRPQAVPVGNAGQGEEPAALETVGGGSGGPGTLARATRDHVEARPVFQSWRIRCAPYAVAMSLRLCRLWPVACADRAG
jgi:hypothetical protein